MKVVGFIFNLFCSFIIGGILALEFGFTSFLIGTIASLVTYYICKGIAIASTAPISYLTESDIGIWSSQCFLPWLFNYVGWMFLVFTIAINA